MQPVDQAIRSLLMFQPVHRKCLSAMPVGPHHALDEHLREIVEHTSVLQIDQRRRQRISLLRGHLQHPRRIKTLRLQCELPQLHLGKKSTQGNRRPLQSKPSLAL